MSARFLVSHPCEDACCEVMTQRTVEGAPVYLCTGCDSEWIELRERTTAPQSPAAATSVGTDAVDEAVPPRLTGGE